MKSDRTPYVLLQVFMTIVVFCLFFGAGISLIEYGGEHQNKFWQGLGMLFLTAGLVSMVWPVNAIRERMEEDRNFRIWKATVAVVSPSLLILCYLPGVGPIVRQSIFGPDYINPFTADQKTGRTNGRSRRGSDQKTSGLDS
ncbi:MAG: hypothetical protein SynsKO_07200 [Synoicihabitans sp.]